MSINSYQSDEAFHSGMEDEHDRLAARELVGRMTTHRLRRELKTLQGFEPKPQWMHDRINDIRSELGWRERADQ